MYGTIFWAKGWKKEVVQYIKVDFYVLLKAIVMYIYILSIYIYIHIYILIYTYILCIYIYIHVILTRTSRTCVSGGYFREHTFIGVRVWS